MGFPLPSDVVVPCVQCPDNSGARTAYLKTNCGLTDAMQRKLLVFGANGQVGREIASRARALAVGFDRASVDICIEAAVRQAVRDHPPVAIVNAAAYTAVDRAETEPDEALRV